MNIEHQLTMAHDIGNSSSSTAMNRREWLASAGAAALLPAVGALAAPVSMQQPATRGDPAFEAALLVGPVQSGAGNHRWAQIMGGEISGHVLAGRTQTGRLDWLVDPCSGAAEVVLICSVLRADGATIELRDRTDHTRSIASLEPGRGLPTAPQLFHAGGRRVSTRLAGRLDSTSVGQGLVRLQAFEAG